MALSLCHLCKSTNYKDRDTNTKAISLLRSALISPYNSYEFIKNDSFNYGNVVLELISTLLTDKSLIDEHAYGDLVEAFKLISN